MMYLHNYLYLQHINIWQGCTNLGSQGSSYVVCYARAETFTEAVASMPELHVYVGTSYHLRLHGTIIHFEVVYPFKFYTYIIYGALFLINC